MILENKIWGIVAPPRLSLNNNLYLPESMIAGDGKTVPFYFDHEDFEIGSDGQPTGQLRNIKPRGYVTLQWNQELQRMEYIGQCTDPASVQSIQRGERPYVSLAAMPRSYDVYRGHIVPLGLDFFSVSAVPKPGIPETTLNMERVAEGFFFTAHNDISRNFALLEGNLKYAIPNSEDKAQDSGGDFSWRAAGRSARTTGGRAVRFWSDKIPGKRDSLNVDAPGEPKGTLDTRSDIISREVGLGANSGAPVVFGNPDIGQGKVKVKSPEDMVEELASMSTSTAGAAMGVDTWQGPAPIYKKGDSFAPSIDPKPAGTQDTQMTGDDESQVPAWQRNVSSGTVDQRADAQIGDRGSGANVRSFYNEDLRLRVEFLLLQQRLNRRNSLLERLIPLK